MERLFKLFTRVVLLWLGIIGFSWAAVATPTLTVPPPGEHGFAYLSSGLNLPSYGFMEEEFFFSGTAQAYINDGDFGADGQWHAQPNPGITAQYTSRILVRRPARGHFNGTVIVEWMNVSGGRDVTPDWTMAHQELLREGYAYVGVSAQYVGVAFNKNWDASRYGALFHPGDSFSYDIFSQAGQAVLRPQPGGPQPLGNLTRRVRAVIAAGESQSASRMWTYYNAIHPQAGFFDGFLIHSIGGGAALSQSYAAAAGGVQVPPPNGVPATPDIAVPGGQESVIRTDLDDEVLLVQTETDVVAPIGPTAAHEQPDSATFRVWELAGTAHGDQYQLAESGKDFAKSGVGGELDCGNPPINAGPQTYALRAAMHALHSWVRYGRPAPVGPRFDIVNGSIVRDPATGNVVSGIRLPQVAVPIATFSGTRPPVAVAGNPFCFLFGATDYWNGDRDSHDGVTGLDISPTPEPDVRVLYPRKRDYLRPYAAETLRSVFDGFIRPRDILEVYREGSQNNPGR